MRTEQVGGSSLGVSCFALIILALALIGSPDDGVARPKQLTSTEVEDLVKGNTVQGFNPSDDSSYTMFHSGDGRVRAELRNVNGELSRSDGKWWVNEEGKLCLDWKNFRWVNSCVFVISDKESLTFQDDNGRIVSFGEVQIGNPNNI